MEEQIKNRESMTDKIARLRKSKEQYDILILRNLGDPFKELVSTMGLKSIVGPLGSNLLAMVRIGTAGAKAKRYREDANKELFNNKILQLQINDNFLSTDDQLIVHPRNNPYIIKADGIVIKLCWHHSPNHISTVSLIPESLHGYGIHADGKGGRRYEVPDLLKRKKWKREVSEEA